MTFEAALNLLWALVGVAALGVLGVSELRRRRATTVRARCRRGLAVLIATVALFPCVSASDDLVRFEHFQLNLKTHAGVGTSLPEKANPRPALYLARLLEALENFQISAVGWLFVTLGFFALIRVVCKLSCERSLPSPTGRAPPDFGFLI